MVPLYPQGVGGCNLRFTGAGAVCNIDFCVKKCYHIPERSAGRIPFL